MVRYAARRLALAIPLLAGLSILAFGYIRLIPGDPVVAMLGVNSDPALAERLREQFGLNQPVLSQYTSWVAGVVQGDFGVSFRSQLPIGPILVDRIPATVELAAAGLLIGLAIAIPAGVIAGVKRGSRLDALITSSTLFGLALPGFWLGTILMLFFALRLGAFPSQGYVPFVEDPLRNLQLLFLPALTLGLSISPYLARLTRATVVEVLEEPFLSYARAQGHPQLAVARHVVLRNVLPSLIVAIGLTAGFLLAGSIVVEELFNWPGTGRLVVRAVIERDYAMIQALVLIYGVVFIVVNLLAELAQGVLDPRIRLT